MIFFKKKYNTLWQKIRKEREQIFMRGTKYTYFSLILHTAGKAFLVFFSIKSILQGNMSIGTLSMFLTLSSQTSSLFGTLLLTIKALPKGALVEVEVVAEVEQKS